MPTCLSGEPSVTTHYAFGMDDGHESPDDPQRLHQEWEQDAVGEEAVDHDHHGACGAAGAKALGTHAVFAGEGCAAAGNLLKTKLTARGVSEDLLLDVRLVSPGKEGREPFDFFRDRVMFPIADAHGQLVAFAGRLIESIPSMIG